MQIIKQNIKAKNNTNLDNLQKIRKIILTNIKKSENTLELIEEYSIESEYSDSDDVD